MKMVDQGIVYYRHYQNKDNGNYFPDEWQDGYAAGWNACLNKILDKGNRG